MQFFVSLIAAMLMVGCGGGSTRDFRLLKRPIDMAVSTSDIQVRGERSRLLYILSGDSATISILDQRKEDFLDAEDGDDFRDSPITVGGWPVAIAVDDRGELSRLFVADESSNQLFAFDAVAPTDPGDDLVEHSPVDLGGTEVARASRPIFRDVGRNSNPAFSDIEVDADAQVQDWELKYLGEGKGYRAIGSVVGEISERIFEDVDTSLDGGKVRFRIRSGGESTTDGDQFRFGVNRLRPLDLPGKPTDMQVQGDRLLISIVDPGGLVLVHLDTFSIEQPPEDLSGRRPTFIVASDTAAFLNDVDSTNVVRVDLNTSAVSTFDAEVMVETLGLDPNQEESLYLFPRASRDVRILDLNQSSVGNPLELSSFGLGFEAYSFEGEERALVPTVEGNVDVLELPTFTRFDTQDNRPSDDTESDYGADEFFDTGEKSSPNLISVNTRDDQTRSERWQVIYEGVIPGARNLSGTVSGDVFSLSEGNLGDLAVQVGDLALFGEEEVEIAEIQSDTALRLSSTPVAQGAVAGDIRVSDSYVVIGSLSGLQANRVLENQAYLSDEGDIALTIRSSLTEPTTRGDYFTFLTFDGRDPIFTSGKRLARVIRVFTRPGQSQPTAYVIHEANDSVSALNLDSLRERKVIR